MVIATNHKTPPVKPEFTGATGKAGDYSLKLQANIKLFLDGLSMYETKDSVNTPGAEADIKHKFQEFLIGCEFYMAQSDFDELLEESKKPRNDGSISWYHQLTPILILLSMVQDKTLSLNDLEKYGGLETAVRIALRHDSIEDFGKSFEQFENDQKQKIELVSSDLKNRDILISKEKEYKNLTFLMNGLKLMTKKIAVLDDNGNPQYHSDGRMIKSNLFENTRAYIHNMIESKDASPVVWILKVCDGIHNLSSMIGAPKFTAPRRREYSNQREDMYGSRQGLPEIAMSKWPNFEKAITRVDHLMGSVLYTNFGYLEYVDQEDAYPNNSGKYKDGETVRALGIGKYMNETIEIKIPRGLNPLYTLLDTIKFEKKNNESPLFKQRISIFWEDSIKPALQSYAPYFPRIFNSSNDNHKFTPS